MIAHHDRQDILVSPGHVDFDRGSAVAQGVADDVRHDDVEASWVQARRSGGVVVTNHHAVLPSATGQDPVEQLGDVHEVDDEAFGADIEPGDLEDVVHEPA